MISNFFIQLAHIELLITYSVKDILSLIRRDSRFDTKLVNDLFFEGTYIDENSHHFIFDNLVSWLYDRGENPDEFVERIVKRCADFEAIPARSVLRSYLPFVSQFYQTKDVRALCLEIIPKRYPFLTNASILKDTIEGETRNMFVTFQFETPGALVSNPMRWVPGLFRVGPLLLNTPAYEYMEYSATQTSFIEALENRVPAEMRDGNVFIGDRLVGRTTTFGECLDKLGFDWPNKPERDMVCVFALEDVFDAKTNSHLLHKGCYYGAPCNILDVRFKANVVTPEPFLKLMSSVVKQEFDVWQPIQKAHEQLLGAMNDSVEIIYYKSDDSISVNNKHLMRNVPARILRNLLREYTATGREEYENREFKRDPSICLDPQRPNFESRLNRVIAHINGTDDKSGVPSEGVKKYFEIERHRRGGFRFLPKCKIIFREE